MLIILYLFKMLVNKEAENKQVELENKVHILNDNFEKQQVQCSSCSMCEKEDDTKKVNTNNDLHKRLDLLEQKIDTNAEMYDKMIKRVSRVEQLAVQLYQMSCARENQLAEQGKMMEQMLKQLDHKTAGYVNQLDEQKQMMEQMVAQMGALATSRASPPHDRPEASADVMSSRREEDDERRSAAGRDARESLSLPIFDGSCSFKGHRILLEQFFEDTEQPRRLETSLFLESLRRGNKQAKEFHQEVVDEGLSRNGYSFLVTSRVL